MSEPAKAVNLITAENVEGRINVAQALGSSATAMYVYDLDPGEGSCPYHYEYEEEWLLVVTGSVVVRRPDGEQTLEQGELVRFAAGPDGAHKIMNRSSLPARTLIFSSARTPGISVYPDSDKVGVFSGDPADDYFLPRGAAVPWAHGEEGWDRAD
jgi:uncharacterized cupin superfamily protein